MLAYNTNLYFLSFFVHVLFVSFISISPQYVITWIFFFFLLYIHIVHYVQLLLHIHTGNAIHTIRWIVRGTLFYNMSAIMKGAMGLIVVYSPFIINPQMICFLYYLPKWRLDMFYNTILG